MQLALSRYNNINFFNLKMKLLFPCYLFLYFQEMECYIGHIREIAEKRTDHLETETLTLRNKLYLTQQQTATLNNLLQRSGLDGLDALGEDNLGEQVRDCLFLWCY